MSDHDDVPETRDLYPPVQPHIVPPSEWNPRGGDTAAGYMARTAPRPQEPQNPQAAYTNEAPMPPPPVLRQDPRVEQLRREARDDVRRAVGAQPVRQAPVEPMQGQPPSAADYFRQEVASQIVQGRDPGGRRGY
jgi:hypothetical protein